MDSNDNNTENVSQFKTVTSAKKKNIWDESKVRITVRATDQWVSLFKNYLHENKLSEI